MSQSDVQESEVFLSEADTSTSNQTGTAGDYVVTQDEDILLDELRDVVVPVTAKDANPLLAKVLELLNVNEQNCIRNLNYLASGDISSDPLVLNKLDQSNLKKSIESILQSSDKATSTDESRIDQYIAVLDRIFAKVGNLLPELTKLKGGAGALAAAAASSAHGGATSAQTYADSAAESRGGDTVEDDDVDTGNAGEISALSNALNDTVAVASVASAKLSEKVGATGTPPVGKSDETPFETPTCGMSDDTSTFATPSAGMTQNTTQESSPTGATNTQEAGTQESDEKAEQGAAAKAEEEAAEQVPEDDETFMARMTELVKEARERGGNSNEPAQVVVSRQDALRFTSLQQKQQMDQIKQTLMGTDASQSAEEAPAAPASSAQAASSAQTSGSGPSGLGSGLPKLPPRKKTTSTGAPPSGIPDLPTRHQSKTTPPTAGANTSQPSQPPPSSTLAAARAAPAASAAAGGPAGARGAGGAAGGAGGGAAGGARAVGAVAGASEPELSSDKQRKIRDDMLRCLTLLYRSGLNMSMLNHSFVVHQIARLESNLKLKLHLFNTNFNYYTLAKRRGDEEQAAAAAGTPNPKGVLESHTFRILVLGPEGSGKTSTIMNLLDKPRSEWPTPYDKPTSKTTIIRGQRFGLNMEFIDTPGLVVGADQQGTNIQMLRKVHRLTKKLKPSAMIYVDRADVIRMRDQDLPMMRQIAQVFGMDVWYSSVVLLTHMPPPNVSRDQYEQYQVRRSQMAATSVRKVLRDPRVSPLIQYANNHVSAPVNDQGEPMLPDNIQWRKLVTCITVVLDIMGQADRAVRSDDKSPTQTPAQRMMQMFQMQRTIPIQFYSSSTLNMKKPKKLPEDERAIMGRRAIRRLSGPDRIREERRRNEYERQKKSEMSQDGIPIPAPETPLLPTFHPYDGIHRYQYMETNGKFITRPMMDVHGRDGDVGIEGFQLDKHGIIRGLVPGRMRVVGGMPYGGYVTMKEEGGKRAIQSQFESAFHHSPNWSTVCDFSTQDFGDTQLYALQTSSRYKVHPRNKVLAGLHLARQGSKKPVSKGIVLSDQFKMTDCMALVLSTNMIGVSDENGQSKDNVKGLGAELKYKPSKSKQTPKNTTFLCGVTQTHQKSTNGIVRAFNLSTQTSITPETTMVARLQMQRRQGQLVFRMQSTDKPVFGYALLIPVVAWLFNKVKGGDQYDE